MIYFQILHVVLPRLEKIKYLLYELYNRFVHTHVFLLISVIIFSFALSNVCYVCTPAKCFFLSPSLFVHTTVAVLFLISLVDYSYNYLVSSYALSCLSKRLLNCFLSLSPFLFSCTPALVFNILHLVWPFICLDISYHFSWVSIHLFSRIVTCLVVPYRPFFPVAHMPVIFYLLIFVCTSDLLFLSSQFVLFLVHTNCNFLNLCLFASIPA